MVGIDANFERDGFTVEAEAAYLHQEITGGALKKWGYAVVAAYRVNPMFEPLLAIDDIRLNGVPANDRPDLLRRVQPLPLPRTRCRQPWPGPSTVPRLTAGMAPITG